MLTSINDLVELAADGSELWVGNVPHLEHHRQANETSAVSCRNGLRKIVVQVGVVAQHLYLLRW